MKSCFSRRGRQYINESFDVESLCRELPYLIGWTILSRRMATASISDVITCDTASCTQLRLHRDGVVRAAGALKDILR